jgi:hypothetical protein
MKRFTEVRRLVAASAAALTVLIAAACEDSPEFSVGLAGTGTILLQAFYDYDGQPGPGGADDVAPGLRFEVLLPGSNTTVASGVTDGAGLAALALIPTGTYELRVDPDYLTDTLELAWIDTTAVSFTPGDSVALRVGVTPPTRSIADARALPEGRRVWVEGMVLNSRANSIDGAVHMRASEGGALRARFPAATSGAPGDSARILGVAVGQGSRRYLGDGLLRVVASAVRPILPVVVSLADAPGAGGGALDAELVVIQEGTVTDAATIPFVGQVVTISAGGANLEVVFLEQNGLGGFMVVPGMPVVSVSGVLVPDPNNLGRWQLVPRGGADIQLGPAPGGGG